MTFPELCQTELGILPDKVIKGFIPVTSTHDRFEVYGEYLPPGEDFWREMMGLSKQLYNSSFLPGGAKYAKGFYPLCDYCPGQFNCPKFSAVQVDTPDKTLQRIKKIKEVVDRLLAHKVELEGSLKQYYQLATKIIGKAYIECPTGKFRVTTSSGREYFTKVRIHQALCTNGLPGDSIETIMSNAAMHSEPSSRLNIVWADKGKAIE